MSPEPKGNLNFASVWSLVTGGMVGGGIYTALGVVVAVSLQWSWLSFMIAGIIAITSAYSYVQLANKFEESGGAFEYLREINKEGIAGSLSWLLIIGYVLTIALYAFAFGHYISFAVDAGPWLIRILSAGILFLLIALNLAGVGKTASVEIVIVWINLIILIGLGVYGLLHWDIFQLMAGNEPRRIWSSFIGAAAIFVSYEGFQLVTYEYEEIKNPKENLSPAILSGVAVVIVIYCLVSLGAVSLAGAIAIIDEKQVSLAVAAKEALGLPGLVTIVTAAGLATAAAINSTLFSTAKLAERVAEDGELPKVLEHKNSKEVPDRSVIIFGVLAALLSISGSLSMLVEAASLVFLFTFGAVNIIAIRIINPKKWIPWIGVIVGGVTMIILLVRLYFVAPMALSILLILTTGIVIGRPYILKKVSTDDKRDNGEESL